VHPDDLARGLKISVEVMKGERQDYAGEVLLGHDLMQIEV